MQPCDERDADVFVKGQPRRLETIPEFFLAKNYANWGAPVLPAGQSWERLGDVLGERFGAHVWHPGHWATPPEKGPSHVSCLHSTLPRL